MQAFLRGQVTAPFLKLSGGPQDGEQGQAIYQYRKTLL